MRTELFMQYAWLKQPGTKTVRRRYAVKLRPSKQVWQSWGRRHLLPVKKKKLVE